MEFSICIAASAYATTGRHMTPPPDTTKPSYVVQKQLCTRERGNSQVRTRSVYCRNALCYSPFRNPVKVSANFSVSSTIGKCPAPWISTNFTDRPVALLSFQVSAKRFIPFPTAPLPSKLPATSKTCSIWLSKSNLE